MKKILIVDDDPVVTAVYARHFRAGGFEVRVANSGRDGLEAVRAFLPDAVLLDLNMPGVSGVDWLEQVRSEPRFARLPVTVLTAGTVGWQLWAANNANVSFIFKDGAVPRDVVDAIDVALKLAAPPLPPG